MQSILQYHLLCRSVQDQYGRTNEKSAGFVSPFPKQILVSANKDEFGRRNTSDNLNSEYEKAPRYFDPELRHDEPIQVSLANGTQTAIGTSLGFPLEGVKVRERTSEEGESGLVFVVGWDTPDNPMNPHNWSMVCRIVTTIMVCLILTVVSATSSIDAAVKPQSSQAYHVVAGNLTTGKLSVRVPLRSDGTERVKPTRLLFDWIRHRCSCGGFLLRDLWPKRCIHNLYVHLHNLHHGYGPRPKLRRRNCV